MRSIPDSFAAAAMIPSLMAAICLLACCVATTPSRAGEPLPKLTREQASSFARLALKGTDKEYPNKPEHVMAGPTT